MAPIALMTNNLPNGQCQLRNRIHETCVLQKFSRLINEEWGKILTVRISAHRHYRKLAVVCLFRIQLIVDSAKLTAHANFKTRKR